MRFHVVGLPHTNVTRDFAMCAYTEKLRKFCIMMKARGHTVFLYAGETNEAPCDEHIVCISEAERVAALGDVHFLHFAWDGDLPLWERFNANATEAIRARAEPEDFVCIVGASAQRSIALGLPQLRTVEIGIGYTACFSKYRIFESYAWMHTVYGLMQAQQVRMSDELAGNWFDAVIPGYIEPEAFPFRESKDDYFLFIGRLIPQKGYAIAQRICESLGRRLVLAGLGEHQGYGEFVGTVGPERRGELMAGATAVFVPTHYIEPFGNVAVEAMACGTPVITSPFGAFTETVVQGITGFRCHTIAELAAAAQRAPELNPYAIRKHAMDNYSLDAIGEKYERHFQRLLSLSSNVRPSVQARTVLHRRVFSRHDPLAPKAAESA